MATVWRLHLKNDVEKPRTRSQLLEFCQKNHLIGVGWNMIKTRSNNREDIRNDAQYYSANQRNMAAGIKAVNAMREIALGDLIWTRLNGIYFLCKVTGLWKDSKPTQEHVAFDISNYCTVEWQQIGTEEVVPGKVISSMRPASTLQRVNNIEDVSCILWNRAKNPNAARPHLKADSYWQTLREEAIEEVVLLYLQVEKNYYVYTSTVKLSTEKYECVLTDKEGHRAYPQVKSGDTPLDAREYLELLNADPSNVVYLFAASESYTRVDNSRIIYLTRKEIDSFIKSNMALLPESVRAWLALCR